MRGRWSKRRRPPRPGMELELVAQKICHVAVRRPRRRGRARRSPCPASAATTFSTVAGVLLASGAGSRSARPILAARTGPGGCRPPAGGRCGRQPKRAGSNASGSGASSRAAARPRWRGPAAGPSTGPEAGRWPRARSRRRRCPAGHAPDQGVVVGRGRPQADPGLEVGGVVQARRDDQALAQQLVQPGRGDVVEKPAPARTCRRRRPAPRATGPDSGSGAVARWATRRRPPRRRDARSGPWWGRRGGAGPATPPRPPSRRPPATARAAQATVRSPSTPTAVTACAARRPPRPVHRAGDEVTPRAAAPTRSAPAMPRPSTRAAAGGVQGPVDRAEGREERARLLRRDLGRLARRARRRPSRRTARTTRPRGRAGPPRAAPQAPYAAPATSTPSAARRSSRPGSARRTGAGRARARHRSRAGRRREDPRAGVGGPPRMGRVDHRDRRPQAGQLVGQRQADQPGPDHHHVARSPLTAPSPAARRPACQGGAH